MGLSEYHLERLLSRYDTVADLELSWDMRVERHGLFHKDALHDRAMIRNISLDGALVEVASRNVHEVGEHIAVRFDGSDGEAVIRHCHPGDNDSLFYGVQFLPDPMFTERLAITVGELRGHASELKTAWNRRN